jgi:hypothetical protein
MEAAGHREDEMKPIERKSDTTCFFFSCLHMQARIIAYGMTTVTFLVFFGVLNYIAYEPGHTINDPMDAHAWLRRQSFCLDQQLAIECRCLMRLASALTSSE